MIFCDQCFRDQEITSIIRRIHNIKKGTCPTCGSNEGHLYDTEVYHDLTDCIEGLLSIYAPESKLPEEYPKSEMRLLAEDFDERWNMFSENALPKAQDILKAVCNEVYNSIPEIFEENVGIAELYDKDFLERNSLLKKGDWWSFVKGLQNENRYHSKALNLRVLEELCSSLSKKYKRGTLFKRARISDRNGYPTCEMSAPPIGKSSEGRANAKGITCLYLANDVETALHEVRAGVFDFVSVGTFLLKEDIDVVNLRAISNISPVAERIEPLQYAVNKEWFLRLNDEMSRTLRRSDSTIDYVPTQYIVDFIKSIEENDSQRYAGVEYNSTTNPGGYNLAMFNPALFECTEVEVYDIESLQYDKKIVS